MQPFKRRLFRTTPVKTLIFLFTFILSMLYAEALVCQTLVPEAPVPPSVTFPAVEKTSPSRLTPSSDINKMPPVPANPNGMKMPKIPEPPRPPQNKPASGGQGKQASFQDKKNLNSGASSVPFSGIPKKPSITASDINTLSSLAGFQNLFSAQGLGSVFSEAGINTGTSAFLSPNGLSEKDNTAALLHTIIEKLDALQKNFVPASAQGASSVSQKKEVLQGGRVLRFIAGNYNILPSCTSIFISQPESDGSFLLTGDRRYRVSDKIYGETFYMLFKAADAGTFNVAFSLSPHEKESDSLLSALESASFLQAVRTGNLVTMRTLNRDIRVDLLLDIDFNGKIAGPEKSR